MVKIMANNCADELNYYYTLDPPLRATITQDLRRSLYIMRELSSVADQYGEKALGAEVATRMNKILSVYQPELLSPDAKK
jgi:hypothetical protein